jgi:hypothetical protein
VAVRLDGLAEQCDFAHAVLGEEADLRRISATGRERSRPRRNGTMQ